MRVLLNLKYICMILILTLFSFSSKGQVDTEFWFAAPRTSSVHSLGPFIFKIASQNNPLTNVTISRPADSGNGWSDINLTMGALEFRAVNIGENLLFPQNVNDTVPGQVTNYGIRIQSDQPITVYYEANGDGYDPDIFTLKGRNSLGTEFYTPFQNKFENAAVHFSGDKPKSAIDIVATEDNTTVNVTLSQNVVGHNAGTTATIVLNQGQTYRFKAISYLPSGHLGGTRINSDKDIAVTISDVSVSATRYDGVAWCADMIGDQLVPISVLGKEYALIRGWLDLVDNEHDFVFFQATKNNTVIDVSTASGTSTILASPGNMAQFPLDDELVYIKASEPIYVLHVSGNGCELGGAIIPPIDQCSGSKDVAFSRTDPDRFGLNLLVRNGGQDDFTVSGASITISPADFTPVPGTNGSWLALNKEYDAVEFPSGQNVRILNSTTFFHLGTINGEETGGGTRYGYFSNFSNLDLGATVTVCPGTSVDFDLGFGADSYVWNTGQTGPVQSFTAAGVYSVTATFGGCSATDVTEIKHKNYPSSTLGSNKAICGSTTLTAANPNQWSYQWSSGQNTKSITTSVPGIYTVTVTNLAGCSRVDAVELFPDPMVSVSLDDAFICHGQTVVLEDGSADSYMWSNGANTSAITIGQAGVYGLTKTISGCSAYGEMTLTVLPLPEIELVGKYDLCEGDVQTLDPGNAAVYNWSSGQGTRTIDVNSTAEYGLTITDINGCENAASTNVEVHANPIVDLTDQTICEGEVAALDAGVQDNYQWSTSSNQRTISPTVQNTYHVTVTSDYGCADRDTMMLTVIPVPKLEDLSLSCNGTNTKYTITASFTGGDTGSYAVNGLVGTLVNNVFISDELNNLDSYDFTLDDGTGCAPVVIAGSHDCGCDSYSGTFVNYQTVETCEDDTIVLFHNGNHVLDADDTLLYVLHTEAGTTISDIIGVYRAPEIAFDSVIMELDKSYYLSPVVGNKSVDGTIDFIADNCLSVGVSVRLIFRDKPEPVMASAEYCAGDSIRIDPGSFSSYVWNDGTTVGKKWVTTPGTYGVTVSHGFNCFSETEAQMTEIQWPVYSLRDTAICSNTTIELSYLADQFQWSTGAVSSSITVDVQGVYYVTATNGLGCVGVDSMMLTVIQAPEINLVDTGLCVGSSIVLDAGTGAQHSWSDGSTSQTLQVSQAGTYLITVTSDNGCSEVGEVTIAEWALPEPAFDNITACMLPEETLNPGSFNGYIWFDGSTESSLQILHDTVYSVTVTSSDGCSESISVDLDIFQAPELSAYVDNEVVCGDQEEVNLSIHLNDFDKEGPFDLYYSNGSDTLMIPGVGHGETLIPLQNDSSTSYTILEFVNDRGCVFPDRSHSGFDYTVVDVPILYVATQGGLCPNDPTSQASLEFSVEQASMPWDLTYRFDGELVSVKDITESNYFIKNAGQGSYEFIFVIDENRCQAMADPDGSVEITLPSLPESQVEIAKKPTCEGTIFTINASSEFDKVEWHLGDLEFNGQLIDVEVPFGVELSGHMITTFENCTDTAALVLEKLTVTDVVLSDINVFSPTGDGINDYFELDPEKNFSDCATLIIYDRWGVLIYKGEKGETSWDGNGYFGSAPEGTYYVIFEVGGEVLAKHSLTLLRDN